MVSKASEDIILVDTVTVDEVCTDQEYDKAIKKKELFYSFKSKYSEEVLGTSLMTIFPLDGSTSTTLVLRDMLSGKTDDHLYTLKVLTDAENFSWPEMEARFEDIFREARRL